eukprot:700807-Prymnesium_polylepis.1
MSPVGSMDKPRPASLAPRIRAHEPPPMSPATPIFAAATVASSGSVAAFLTGGCTKPPAHGRILPTKPSIDSASPIDFS